MKNCSWIWGSGCFYLLLHVRKIPLKTNNVALFTIVLPDRYSGWINAFRETCLSCSNPGSYLGISIYSSQPSEPLLISVGRRERSSHLTQAWMMGNSGWSFLNSRSSISPSQNVIPYNAHLKACVPLAFERRIKKSRENGTIWNNLSPELHFSNAARTFFYALIIMIDSPPIIFNMHLLFHYVRLQTYIRVRKPDLAFYFHSDQTADFLTVRLSDSERTKNWTMFLSYTWF